MKKRYKSKLIGLYFQSYTANLADDNSIVKFCHNFAILDVIKIIAKIWDETSTATLANVNNDSVIKIICRCIKFFYRGSIWLMMVS